MASSSDGCSSAPPAHIQGSCTICFEDLRQTDKISAIICGHIYHHGCISQWIATKRQCPSCRRAVPKNGFVEKLFFDVQRLNGEQEKPPEIDYREEHYKLSTTLKVEKEKLEQLDTENKALKIEVKSLEKKVHKEKDKYRAEIPKLQATIKHLSLSSEETDYLKRELAEAKNKLKASEFYKILTTHSDQAEKQLGEYLRKSGSLDTEKFFQLQKAQIKDLTEKRREAAKEIEQLKLENQSLKRKAQEEANVRKTLKKSVLELRERANVDTPITNKRLRDVLEEKTPNAAKRRSMGFDDSSQLIDDDLSFFKQQENKRTPPAPPAQSKASTSSMAPFSFDDEDDDDEYFRTPKITEKKKSVLAEKSINDDSFDFDIQVPQSIINRIPPKLPGKAQKFIQKSKTSTEILGKKAPQPKFPSENSFNIDSSAVPKSILPRIPSKPIGSPQKKLTEKPKNSSEAIALKRYQSVDVLADKPKKVIPPPVKTARISSFFARTTSTQNLASSSSASKEYVTID